MDDLQHESDVFTSKTQKKKHMHALQDLGLELAQLSLDTLKKMSLPADLLDALATYKKITSNGALKRQTQYIGRLMREIDDIESLQVALERLKGSSAAYNAYLHRLEALRERLLADDHAVTALLDVAPNIEAVELRTHIRNARKEKALNKPPKAYRALFQMLKASLDEQDIF